MDRLKQVFSDNETRSKASTAALSSLEPCKEPAVKPHTTERKLGLLIASKSFLEVAAGQSCCRTSCLFLVGPGSRSDAYTMGWGLGEGAGVWVKGSCSSIGAVALEENGPRVAKEEVLR